MIDSLRNLKLRIKSVENTKKITRAMEMVSASKLNRVRNALFLERPYFEKLESMTLRLLAGSEAAKHPFLEKRTASGKIVLCVITSDAGLCSVYNYALIRAAENFINSMAGRKVALVTVGREGFNYFRKLDFPIIKTYAELYGRYSDKAAQELYADLTGLFLNQQADEIYIAYTHFASTLRLKPAVIKFLNMEYPQNEKMEYIIEPDLDSLISQIVPAYLAEKIRLILLDTFTSEHASRMIAMKMATDNARDLIDSLTLLRNKARQASITKEILEVVMSAEALKGQ
jgi:F-type H+-transporting ATPase subunit gamma